MKHLFVLLMLVVACYLAMGGSQDEELPNARKNKTISTGKGGLGRQPPEPTDSKIPIEEPIKFVKTKRRQNSTAVMQAKTKTSHRGKGETQSYNDTTRTGPQLIAAAKAKLNGFTGPIKTNVQNKLTALNTRWESMSDDDKEGLQNVMSTVVDNIDALGNAGEDPIAAVQGAINIVSSVSALFGPAGQIVSFGLGFVSGLLGLFGKSGEEPKPLATVVKEQMEKVLNEFHIQRLQDKGRGLMTVYTRSLAYLEGPLSSNTVFDIPRLSVFACRLQLSQGDEFLDELGAVIKRMVNENKPEDAKKVIAAVETYANLAALKDMILTQIITLSTGVFPEDANGVLSSQRTHRNIAKGVLEVMYTSNLGSKILPYFDRSVSVVTDTYGVNVLGLRNFDRSIDGLHCLSIYYGGSNKDLIWSTSSSAFYVNGKPYLTVASQSNSNCYWKLVNHGHGLFSIVNVKGCSSNEHYCGALLSFDIVEGNGFGNLRETDGKMWQIDTYGSRKRILTKWPCYDTSSSNYIWCNRQLTVERRRIWNFCDLNEPEDWCYISQTVGKMVPNNGDYTWTLRRAR